MIAPVEDECYLCRGGRTSAFRSGPMDDGSRTTGLAEDDENGDGVVLEPPDDAEVNFIAEKLRQLQGRRYEMMSRWKRCHPDRESPEWSEAPSVCRTSSRATADCETSSDRTVGVARLAVRGVNGAVERTTSAVTDKMNDALLRLRQELASLLEEDDAVFEQLLSIRQTIAQLKQQNDDLYDDAEVTYLSANCGSLRYRYRSSVRKTNPDGCACLASFEQNSEDSGISLESSGVSSPSMSPSPAVPPTADPPALRRVPSFRRDSVTFPLSRLRHSRYDVLSASSQLAKNRSALCIAGNGSSSDRGSPSKTSFHRPGNGNPPVFLVRSRSITLLPRGVLIRREESYDSGIVASPADAEVFV